MNARRSISIITICSSSSKFSIILWCLFEGVHKNKKPESRKFYYMPCHGRNYFMRRHSNHFHSDDQHTNGESNEITKKKNGTINDMIWKCIFEIHIATSTLTMLPISYVHINDDKRDGFRKLYTIKFLSWKFAKGLKGVHSLQNTIESFFLNTVILYLIWKWNWREK